MISYDDGLRRALARRELQLPHMSGDLNQRLMQRMEQPKTIGRKRWIGAIAASVAIAVVLIAGWLSLPSKQDAKVIALENKDIMESPKAPVKAAVDQSKQSLQAVTLPVAQTDKQLSSLRKMAKEAVKRVGEESVEEMPSDTVELTDVQKSMTDYVAQLSQIYGATCLPLDCNDSDSKVYVFQDDEHTDVLGMLKRVVAWIDTDSPSVRLFSASNQMTLELEGNKDEKGVNEVWFADRQYGYVYLYHARAKNNSWTSASCYTAFLARNSYKLSN